MAEGGFELLSRLVAPELRKKNFLEQYGKSLYVFACINKIATKVAATEFEFFKILNSKGETKEIETHPALDLIYKVNPFQTKTEFLETTIINLKCTGDAFWYKVKNKGGKVMELWNLRPDWMEIITDPVKFVKGYKFTKSDGQTVTFAPEEIVHFKYPDPMSNYLGISPLRAAQMRVQTEDFATKFQRDFFLNSARPDALIKNPDTDLTKEQREEIREGWNKMYKGVGKSSKVAILQGGLEYQLIALTQKEMDYIESLKFTRDDILVAFGVPKPIVAVTDDVNRANAETAMYIFLSETIKPELVRLVEKINEEMIIPDFGDEFYMGFVDPTPQNRELILKEYESGLQNNYLLINEVRQAEGMPPVKGGWSFYRPLTDQAFGGLPQSEKSALIKRIMKESDDNEKTIGDFKKPKLFDFKGKYWLKQKFELKEYIVEEIKKIYAKKSLKKRGKKKGYVSLFKDVEQKKTFARTIIKKVDAEIGKLKEAMDSFAAGQKERVLKELNKKKGMKKIQVSVEQIFDEDGELKLTMEFITPYLAEFIRQAGMDALNLLAPQEDFRDPKRIQQVIKRRAEEFAESVNSTTLEKLDGTLSEGISEGEGIVDLRDRVGKVYEEFPEYRSELVARTEATAANNEGFLEGFKQSDVATGKEWINSGDARVREEHMDQPMGVGGEIVALDKAFSNGLQYPSEPNCRCVIGPAFLE